MASPGNQHCASCIGTFSFPIYPLQSLPQSTMFDIIILFVIGTFDDRYRHIVSNTICYAFNTFAISLA